MIAIRKLVVAASAAVVLGLGSAANAALLELALVLDASGSMNNAEWNAQRLGYANALGTVIPTNGSVSISVTRFAQTASVVRPMTLIDSAAALTSLTTFFTTLSQSGNGSTTCFSCAISTAYSTFSNAPDTRRVIDVSTDGDQNGGSNPNGPATVIGTSRWAVDGGTNGGGLADTVNTIGIGTNTAPGFFYGLNAFGLVVTNFDQFEAGLRDKLEREVIGVIPVPGALPLMLSGLLAFGYMSRRRKA